MAKAEQQINVGGPRSDAAMSDQRRMGSVGILLGEHIEVKAPAAISRASSFSVAIFAADNPNRPSRSARALRIAS